MRDKSDISGLESYLKDLDVIPDGAELLPMAAFEKALEERQAESVLRP